MIEISEVLNEMKSFLGMDTTEEFAKLNQATSSAKLAIKTSQVEDIDIIAILACYYYTKPRETDEENEKNAYLEMYQNAVNELKERKINPNDNNGLDEIEGAVYD